MFLIGDIVGCGIKLETREIFWTLNGKYLGIAYTGVKDLIYHATVGLISLNECVN
jgi:hypothetical protein